ncbi:MAG: sulfatase [Actinomycetota bacterium]
MQRWRTATRAAVGLLTLAATAGGMSRAACGLETDGVRPPNVVLIFADDLGYGDLACYGARGIKTPNLDRLAREGTRFTDFYVPQAVCSASRAALLTGCYSNRVGIQGALGPGSKIGINAEETTLAEVLKQRGYATAIYGKWHLGDNPRFLPTRHGFDEYFGLPYSNDMWPNHPTSKSYPPLPLIEGEKVLELNPDQRNLTTWYTERSVKFIEKNKAKPFFLYVPHSMPHVPLFVSEKGKGKSPRGLFGDVIQEIDWSVGEIVRALDRNGLDRNTLVIFTSDNGPWLSYGNHAGSAGPLREGKGTSFEGGVREPAIFRWKGRIPAGGVWREPAMTIDVLPTLARLAGADAPKDRPIDGKDIWPLISRPTKTKSPHDALFIYWGGHLDAVRSGKWKLHLPHEYRSLPGPGGADGLPAPYVQKRIELSLFDLENGPGETVDVSAQHPEVVQRLKAHADRMREDLGDTETGQKGKGVRPPARL